MISSRAARVTRKVVFILVAIATCVITFFPFYWILLMSFQPRDNVFVYPPVFFPQHLSLKNYYIIFTQRPVLQWLCNTIIVSVTATTASLLASTFGSYSLSRFNYRGRGVISFLLLISQMVPVTLLMVPIFMIFRELHMLNQLSGLSLACMTVTTPICVWMLKEYFDSVPYEIEEAAIVDGCSRVGALFRVVLPLSLPGLAATAGFAIVQVWNEYGLALTLITNDSRRVLSVGLASFFGSLYGTSYEQIAAASIVMIVPELFLFMFLQRYLLSGLAAGGVKG
jgi:ABC-type glycerol-3-phosphate transport system permease component